MNPLEVAANVVFVIASGVIGAYLSKYARETGNIYPYFLSGLCTILGWMWVVRRSPYNLVVSSIYWDVLYNVAWMGFTVLALNEAASRMQAVGAVTVLLGLILMGL